MGGWLGGRRGWLPMGQGVGMKDDDSVGRAALGGAHRAAWGGGLWPHGTGTWLTCGWHDGTR